ncbi:MCE-family protein MCE1A, partial [Mycobacterium intracellulare]|uniref:MlaD family protein n=1 Tax=Mycobacterium intracellulare TaxID=1767 RepID=UPI000BDA63B4
MEGSPVQINDPRVPPYKVYTFVVVVVLAVIFTLVYIQFRGGFTPKTELTMLASRAGLVMDPGSKVTYNGVEIGRVGGKITETVRDGKPAAKFTLEVYPRYLALIPSNVNADIKATTVFGGKYVSLTTPAHPSPQKISAHTVLDARSVTTEINTLFQTITSIAQKVDPVKLNLTLSAAAQSLAGLGEKFGQSVVNANAVLDEVNPRMPQARKDIQ